MDQLNRRFAAACAAAGLEGGAGRRPVTTAAAGSSLSPSAICFEVMANGGRVGPLEKVRHRDGGWWRWIWNWSEIDLLDKRHPRRR